MTSQSTTISITVKQGVRGMGWVWSVQRVDPHPVEQLGGGVAGTRQEAWADVASVLYDQGDA
jgi:hypothetical protein